MLKSPEDQQQLLVRNLPNYCHEEIISLEDPLTKEIVVMPVCSDKCLHRQCFDYETFKQANL